MRCDREPHQQAFIPKQQSMGPSCGRLALANHPYDLTVTCQEHIVKKMLEAAFVWVTLGVNVLLARSQLNILVQTWYRPRGVISECIWWQTSAPNNNKKKKNWNCCWKPPLWTVKVLWCILHPNQFYRVSKNFQARSLRTYLYPEKMILCTVIVLSLVFPAFQDQHIGFTLHSVMRGHEIQYNSQ